jgi:hypothetical protein
MPGRYDACPDCGGPKREVSLRCQSCRVALGGPRAQRSDHVTGACGHGTTRGRKYCYACVPRRRVCGVCGGSMDRASKRCRGCYFAALRRSRVRGSRVRGVHYTNCPECGGDMARTSRQCIHCRRAHPCVECGGVKLTGRSDYCRPCATSRQVEIGLLGEKVKLLELPIELRETGLLISGIRRELRSTGHATH